MGFITKLFSTPAAATFAMTDPYVGGVDHLPVASPWSGTTLSKVVLGDLFGKDYFYNPTRYDAMAIPAVARGRSLICGTLSRYPLSLWKPNPDDPSGDTDERLPAPAWFGSTSTGQSPVMRMLWTYDDLLFHGMAVWATERNDEGDIVDAVRVPRENGTTPGWSVDPDTLGVKVFGEQAKADQVIIFEGPQEGLLTMATKAMAASKNLATAWQQRVESPIPLVQLKQTDQNAELEDDEILSMIGDWESARRASGTAFVPWGIEASVMGDVVPDLYIAARNADRIDWANYISLPAAMLDGSMATATLTYSTTEGKRSEFVDYSLNYWSSPIEARLSLDDVTPAGTYTRHNLKWLTTAVQPATNPPGED